MIATDKWYNGGTVENRKTGSYSDERKGIIMAKIEDLLKAEIGAVCIGWQRIEETLGFSIHKDLKDFYSRILCRKINGEVDFVEAEFLEKTGNERNDTWISFNECEGKVEYSLSPVKSLETANEEIEYAFKEWTGGNDFGHRAMIGQFYFNIGEILILFNNDTGKIEWIDCEYGYFDVYEENPNGILANCMQDFLEKLC